MIKLSFRFLKFITMSKEILYHGSPVNFKSFDANKIGTGSGTTGAGIGFYFSNLISGALRYGDYIYEVELPNGKELSNFNRTLTNTKINEILKYIYKNSKDNDNYYQNWYDGLTPVNIKKLSILDEMFNTNSTDTEIIMNIINAGNARVPEMLNALHKLGYTHTTDLLEHGISNSVEDHYILYYEPKIITKYKFKY